MGGVSFTVAGAVRFVSEGTLYFDAAVRCTGQSLDDEGEQRVFGCTCPPEFFLHIYEIRTCRPAVTPAVPGMYCCVGHHVTPSLALLSQLMGSQGVETVSEFCNNASRPKVSVHEWNEAMQPSNFEPTTVNMLFAKCLSKVRMGVSEGLCRMPPMSMRCGVFCFYLLVVFGLV